MKVHVTALLRSQKRKCRKSLRARIIESVETTEEVEYKRRNLCFGSKRYSRKSV